MDGFGEMVWLQCCFSSPSPPCPNAMIGYSESKGFDFREIDFKMDLRNDSSTTFERSSHAFMTPSYSSTTRKVSEIDQIVYDKA